MPNPTSPFAALSFGAEAGPWRVAAARVPGPSHARAGIECQDAFAVVASPRGVAAVVSDGAGSAMRAGPGARLLSFATAERLARLLDGAGPVDAAAVRAAVTEAGEAWRRALARAGASLADHHATLVAAVLTDRGSAFAHVGDGLAGLAAAEDWPGAVLSRPENGEFSNETWFVSAPHWQDHLRVTALPDAAPGDVAVLVTDGAMPFTVGPGGAGLEPGLLAPLSRHAAAEAPGQVALDIAGTLDGTAARRISGDDKTLVWIGRSHHECGHHERSRHECSRHE